MNGTVLVVEDDVALCELLTWNLSAEGYEVRSTGDGEEALLMVREQTPDAIVLDWMIEQVPGIEVCRQIRKDKDTAQIPILMLTARGEEEDMIRGFKTGADDYVTKPFSPRELVLRVQSVMRRALAEPASEEPVSVGRFYVDPSARIARMDGRDLTLTVREFDLLAFLARRPHQAFDRETLLQSVWGWTYGDLSTVTVHVRRLREKIEPDTANPRHLVTVWGVGYRFQPAGEPPREQDRPQS